MRSHTEEAEAIVRHFYSIVSGVESKYIPIGKALPKDDSHVKTAIQCARLHVKGIIEVVTIQEDSMLYDKDITHWNGILSELDKM